MNSSQRVANRSDTESPDSSRRLAADSSNTKPSIFFGMMGTPFQSETVTSLFRMVDSALSKGHRVTVWNCGYATGLSQSSLIRPPDSFATAETVGGNPTTAEVIQALMRKYGGDGRLDWLVCRYCMEERGATQQIPEAKIKIPFTFQHYLSKADVSLVLGVKS
ncbi:hypothetical protein [Paraburkholderia dilworthii]|uniref:hypothetical protein n=1 Tax=Paraburkholderia dilworthii TaxID=948106 RepID=UPI0004298F8A|nr:hypothetical protein [Paraburkholderia dilworthii]